MAAMKLEADKLGLLVGIIAALAVIMPEPVLLRPHFFGLFVANDLQLMAAYVLLIGAFVVMGMAHKITVNYRGLSVRFGFLKPLTRRLGVAVCVFPFAVLVVWFAARIVRFMPPADQNRLLQLFALVILAVTVKIGFTTAVKKVKEYIQLAQDLRKASAIVWRAARLFYIRKLS